MPLALITARSGSKGLPGKHLADLGGRPLIAWTVEAALKSAVFDTVLVSSDDEGIASCCRDAGAEVPFLRPQHLATDDAAHMDVVEHAVTWLTENRGATPEITVLLQPTSPLRSPEDIRGAYRLFDTAGPPAVVSVSNAETPPEKMFYLDDQARISPVRSSPPGDRRRQTLRPAFVENGAIYINRTEQLLRDRDFFPEGTLAYVMPRERSVDIDTELDLLLARSLLAGAK